MFDDKNFSPKTIRFVNVGLVFGTLVLSLIGGAASAGYLTGSKWQEIQSVVTDNNYYRKTLSDSLVSLSNSTQSLAVTVGTLSARLDALNTALQSERQDRLYEQQRIIPK